MTERISQKINKQPPVGSEKGTLEKRLWKRAEDVRAERIALIDKRDMVYGEITEMRAKHLNLHEKDLLTAKESEYWGLTAAIEQTMVAEDTIENALLRLDGDDISEEELLRILPQESGDSTKISKRKQRILEEEERLASVVKSDLFDGMGIPIQSAFGSERTRLTTGRHQKSITGSLDPLSAEGEFFYRTADTHGGKVSHGKKGRTFYRSASGKRIRKK